MDHIHVLLLCSIAFSISSAYPQYSTALPPQYSKPGPQYPNVAQQYSTAAPHYSTPLYSSPASQQYSPAQPQFLNVQPKYSSSQPQYSQPQSSYNQYQTSPIPIVNQNQEMNPLDGSYHYGYQTGNGISAEERGAVKNLGSPDNEINSVQGYFSYPGSDGVQYMLTYTADENGFVPQGAHLPTPPPLPEELVKAYQALPPDNNEYDEKGFPINRQGQQAYKNNGRV